MTLMQRLADVENPDSLSNRLRNRRFRHFETLTASLDRPLRILDVGGTPQFWEQRGWSGRTDVHITVLNIEPRFSAHSNIESKLGEATDLSAFSDRSFDIAFSNSVIEHLFTFARQAAMARELLRVAPALWVQTPNYWFPIEPHFHVPGWQWLPVALRRTLIQRFRCGWRGPNPDPEEADRAVREVRLLTRVELRKLFPQCMLLPERFCGFVKSWIVYRGFAATASLRKAA